MRPFLAEHFQRVEESLLSRAGVSSSASHSQNKGTPREVLINEFLASHLSTHLEVTSGEILTPSSLLNESRPQLDVIVFRRAYPKIEFGNGIHALLAESVIATIEVKSTLTEKELHKAVRAAKHVKDATAYIDRDKLVLCGYVPPSVLSYVVAYNGPKSMTTVAKWLDKSHKSEGISTNSLPQEHDKRLAVPSPSLDGIFIFGRGSMYFDNVPLGFANDDTRAKGPSANWICCDTKCGNVMLLFMFLTQAAAGMHWVTNLAPYVHGFSVGDRIELTNIS